MLPSIGRAKKAPLVRAVLEFSGIDWPLPTIDLIAAMDMVSVKGEGYVTIHINTLKHYLDLFLPKLQDAIQIALTHVTIDYLDYWKSKDFYFAEECSARGILYREIREGIEKLAQIATPLAAYDAPKNFPMTSQVELVNYLENLIFPNEKRWQDKSAP